MRIKNGYAKRTIAGANIVVPVGERGKEFNGMITLNDSASFFWDCFKTDITIDEAVKMVVNEYDIDDEKARHDIESFIKLLKENNLIEE